MTLIADGSGTAAARSPLAPAAAGLAAHPAWLRLKAAATALRPL
jgi:hypothetical protein